MSIGTGHVEAFQGGSSRVGSSQSCFISLVRSPSIRSKRAESTSSLRTRDSISDEMTATSEPSLELPEMKENCSAARDESRNS